MSSIERSRSYLNRSAAVVLAPGLLCDERLWSGVRDRLEAPATVVDFRPADSLEAMAAAVLAAAPDRFVLAGFSMGGMAALLAAASAPERVTGLVLVDAHADPDTPERRRAREQQIAAAEADGLEGLVRDQLKPLYFGEDADVAEHRRLVADMAAAHGPATFARHVRAIMNRPDLMAAAREVRAATTVLVGEADQLATPAAAARLAAAVPRAQLTILPGCGHLAPVERPADVAAAIRGLLSQGSRPC